MFANNIAPIHAITTIIGTIPDSNVTPNQIVTAKLQGTERKNSIQNAQDQNRYSLQCLAMSVPSLQKTENH
jgi:hypothetical protein